MPNILQNGSSCTRKVAPPDEPELELFFEELFSEELSLETLRHSSSTRLDSAVFPLPEKAEANKRKRPPHPITFPAPTSPTSRIASPQSPRPPQFPVLLLLPASNGLISRLAFVAAALGTDALFPVFSQLRVP